MDRVFPKNMDPVDRKDEQKAIGILEDYIRYMKDQIEGAINVILTLNSGTSLAKVAMDIDRLKTDDSTTKRDLDALRETVAGLQTSMSAMIVQLERLSFNAVTRDKIVTEIDQDSTDDLIPTAKAVYDAIGGN